MIRLEQLLGRVKVVVEGDDEKEVIRQIAFWAELPQQCPLCAAPLILTFRSPKGNDYYGLRCTGEVPHESTFGQYRDKSGLYYAPHDPKHLWQQVPRKRDEAEEYDEPPPPEPQRRPQPQSQQPPPARFSPPESRGDAAAGHGVQCGQCHAGLVPARVKWCEDYSQDATGETIYICSKCAGQSQRPRTSPAQRPV